MSLVSESYFSRLPASVVTYGIVPYMNAQSICRLDTALKSCKKFDRTNSVYCVPLQVKDTAYCEKNGISRLIYSAFHKHEKFIHQYHLVSEKEVFCTQKEYIWILAHDVDVTCLKINVLTNSVTRIGEDSIALKIQSNKKPFYKFVLIFGPEEMSYLIKKEFCDAVEDFYVEKTKQSYECQNFPSSPEDGVPSFKMQNLLSDVLSGKNRNFKFMSKNSKKRTFTLKKKSSGLQVSPGFSLSRESVRLSIFTLVSALALKIIISRR